MKRFLGVLFVIAAASVNAMAIPQVPEIDPASAVAALTLLGGTILVIRARLKK